MQIFYNLFHFAIIDLVITTAVGQQGSGKSLGNMHQFVNQGFDLISWIELVVEYRQLP